MFSTLNNNFKEDIQAMGDASRSLMRPRPVTFRYQRPFGDGSKPIQYGLIAEEVADVRLSQYSTCAKKSRC